MNTALLHDSLRRLIPHVDITRIALTGGVAIGLHVEAATNDRTRSLAAEDLDFVAADVDAIRHTVANDFLVSHFHLAQPGYPKFMIQLVDPVARLRLDIFPDALNALHRASVFNVDGRSLRVLAPQDILDHKLSQLAKASEASPIDEKHYEDAKLLGVICERDVPSVASSRLAKTIYSQDIDATCVRCQVSERGTFPLAPKRAIFDLLGYV